MRIVVKDVLELAYEIPHQQRTSVGRTQTISRCSFAVRDLARSYKDISMLMAKGSCEGCVQCSNIGALMIRIGFRGPLYYNYKEPQNSVGNSFGPYITPNNTSSQLSMGSSQPSAAEMHSCKACTG